MILTTTISTNIIACDKLQGLPTKASNWDKNNGDILNLANINNTIYVGTWTEEIENKQCKGNLYKLSY